MKYSTAFRANILKKVFPPENRSVLEVSRENGLSTQTIYTWLKRAKDGTLEDSTDRMRPGDRSIGEKVYLAS